MINLLAWMVRRSYSSPFWAKIKNGSIKWQDATFLITGYADSETGNAELNNKLSQERAEALAAELVKMGVSNDRIQTVAAGGVDTLNPNEFNRRATVEVK